MNVSLYVLETGPIEAVSAYINGCVIVCARDRPKGL